MSSSGRAESTTSIETLTYQSHTSTTAASSTCSKCTGKSAVDAVSLSPQEACQRYEALLSQLAKRALAQQHEIDTLKAQLAQQGGAGLEEAGSSGEGVKDVIARVSETIAQEYLEASDAYLAECMARRLRRITRAHVRKSMDNAIAEELQQIRLAAAAAAAAPQISAESASSLPPSTSASPDLSAIEVVASALTQPTVTASSAATSSRRSSESTTAGIRAPNAATRESVGTEPYGSAVSPSAASTITHVSSDTYEGESDDALSYLLSVFSHGSHSARSTPRRKQEGSSEKASPSATHARRSEKGMKTLDGLSESSMLGSPLSAGQTQLSLSRSATSPLPSRTPCTTSRNQTASAATATGAAPSMRRKGMSTARKLIYEEDSPKSGRPVDELDYLICVFSKR